MCGGEREEGWGLSHSGAPPAFTAEGLGAEEQLNSGRNRPDTTFYLSNPVRSSLTVGRHHALSYMLSSKTWELGCKRACKAVSPPAKGES